MRQKNLIVTGLLLVLITGVSGQVVPSLDYEIENQGKQYSNVADNIIGQTIDGTVYLRNLNDGSVIESTGTDSYGITPTLDGGMIYLDNSNDIINSSDRNFGSSETNTDLRSDEYKLESFVDNEKQLITVADSVNNKILVFNGDRELVNEITVPNTPVHTFAVPETGSFGYTNGNGLYIYDENENLILSNTGETWTTTTNSFNVEDEKVIAGRIGNSAVDSLIGYNIYDTTNGDNIVDDTFSDPDSHNGGNENRPLAIDFGEDDFIFYLINAEFTDVSYLKKYSSSEGQVYSSRNKFNIDQEFSSMDKIGKTFVLNGENSLIKASYPNDPPNFNFELDPQSPSLNDVVDLSVNASDPDGDEIGTIEASVYKDGQLLNTSTFSGNSVDFNKFFTVSEPASYNVTVTVSDEFSAEKTNFTSFNVVDEPPVFEETFTDPETLSLGDDVDVFANVTDQTSVVEVTGDVTEGENLIVNNESFSLNAEGLWENLDLYTADEKDTWYNTTLYATDENNKTSSVEVNRYLDDLDPEIESYSFSPSPENWIEGTSPDLLVRASDDLGVVNVTAKVSRSGSEVVPETELSNVGGNRYNVNDLFEVDDIGGNYMIEIRVYDADNFVSTTETQFVTSRYPRLSSMTYEGKVDVRGSETPNLFVETVFSLFFGVVLLVVLMAMF